MGMYDEVALRCPKCENTIAYQSGAGPSTLSTFDADDVPVAIAQRADGDSVWCQTCNREWRIIYSTVTKHQLHLIRRP